MDSTFFKYILIWCIVLMLLFIIFNPGIVQKTSNDKTFCDGDKSCKSAIDTITNLKNVDLKVCKSCSLSAVWLIFYTLLFGVIIPLVFKFIISLFTHKIPNTSLRPATDQ